MPTDLPPIRMPGGPFEAFGGDKQKALAAAFSTIAWEVFEARYGAEKTAEARRIEAGLAAGLTPAEALKAAKVSAADRKAA